MKRSDIILIVVVLLVAGISFLLFRQLSNDAVLPDGIAVVYYNDERILEIELQDGDHTIYNPNRVLSVDTDEDVFHVLGSNPYGVYIKYQDNKVRVIDEQSPQNICQTQGWTNSPLNPLTCLPNNIIIVIESNDEDLPDDITG